MHDIKDIDSIKLLVDEFYNRVQDDDLLAPVFNTAITDWTSHLTKMYAFWNSVLFAQPGFTGNPFAKHAPLPIQGEHFNTWLRLFRETVDQYFEGPVATDAKNRAELMSTLLQNKLDRIRNNPGKFLI